MSYPATCAECGAHYSGRMEHCTEAFVPARPPRVESDGAGGRSLDQKLADWESLAKRGQVHDGNQAVLDLVGQVREHLRLDAPTTVKPNGEAVPEQRCAPSEDEVSDALSESRWRGLGGMTEKQACDYMARAILDLFGDQPTVTQAKAEALREAAVEFDREAAEDWMSTDRPATDDAATRWLRNYHGSIDSTALLLAFRAGQKAAQPDGESSWIGDRLRARAAAIESGADHG